MGSAPGLDFINFESGSGFYRCSPDKYQTSPCPVPDLIHFESGSGFYQA